MSVFPGINMPLFHYSVNNNNKHINVSRVKVNKNNMLRVIFNLIIHYNTTQMYSKFEYIFSQGIMGNITRYILQKHHFPTL